MKKSVICLLLLVIFGLIYVGIKTYGLYEDNITVEVAAKTASFVLKINDSVINKENNNFIINNLNVYGNKHANPEKIAPGSTAYFDLVFDPESVDTAIRYDITLDFNSITNRKLNFDSIINITKNIPLIRTGEFTYSGVISLEEIKNKEKNTVRTTLIWQNDEANNEEDSKTLGTINIPVNILITQYMGETLTEFVE